MTMHPQPRDARINVRLTTAEAKLLGRAAKADERTLSDWIRKTTVGAARRLREDGKL